MRKHMLVMTLAAACSGLSAGAQDGGPVYPDYLFGAVQQAGGIAYRVPLDGGGLDATDGAGVLPEGVQPDPGWINWVDPGEWCGSTQRYMADLAAIGGDASRALCAPLGPCDDPLLRDAFIYPYPESEVLTVRLRIHIFCESNGGNCAASLNDADVAVARLNDDYAPWGFQFTYTAEFVNNSKYRTLGSGDEYNMKRRYVDVPDAMLNVYVVDTGGVCWGIFPWMAQALDYRGGVVMDDNYFGAGTPLASIFTHEVGHCLGLWHVFHGVDEVPFCDDCYEKAGDPPELRDVTGDLCSDTNPTPKNTNNCFDPLEPDACSGNPWLDTPYLNYMSYAHTCPDQFTAQQAGRMHCWTNDVLTGWLVPLPPPNTPGTPTVTGQGGGQVLIAWADNSNNETGFEVERQKKSGKKWNGTQLVATVGANVTSVTDVPGSGTFRYHVRAYNAHGDSAWSGWTEINN